MNNWIASIFSHFGGTNNIFADFNVLKVKEECMKEACVGKKGLIQFLIMPSSKESILWYQLILIYVHR